MYSLVDLGLIAIFTISLTAAYFAYEKVISIRALSFLRIRKYVLDTFAGTFIGLFTLLFKFILESFDHGFEIPLYFVSGITFLIIRGVNTAAPALIIPLIYNMFDHDFASISYYIVSFFGAICFIYIVVSFYTDIKWANLAVIVSILIMSIIALPLIGSGFEFGYERTTYENSLLLGASCVIVYYPFRTAVRFSISANLLFESVNFVYSRYYRPSLTQSAIGSYITDSKVQKGIFGLFEIRMTAENNEDKAEVLETVLKRVEKYVDDNTTLFSHDSNIYGFFIPFKQKVDLNEITKGNNEGHTNNILIDIADLVNEIDGSYETSNYKVVEVEMKVGTSIYGVQSNSIIQLEKSSLITLKQIDWSSKDKVRNFEFKKHKSRLKDSSRLSLMDNNIDLNNFVNRYAPLFTNEGKFASMHFVTVENNSEYEMVESVDELVRFNNWKFTFDRYFASESISKSKETTDALFIEYSYIFSKSFDVNSFIDKLEKINFDKKNLVITISEKDIRGRGYKNILNVKDAGFKIALKDLTDYKSANKIQPDFIVLKNDQLDNFKKLNAKLVAPYIEDENQLKEALLNDVDFIGGPALQLNSNVKINTKQSKIYIEELIASNKEGI